MVKKICQICGKEFQAELPQTKYCSGACKRAANLAIQARYYKNTQQTTTSLLKCTKECIYRTESRRNECKILSATYEGECPFRKIEKGN